MPRSSSFADVSSTKQASSIRRGSSFASNVESMEPTPRSATFEGIFPECTKQEKALEGATEAYEAAKAVWKRASDKLAELQQQRDSELAANPKAKIDPAVEAEMEELAAAAAECEQKAGATKKLVREAERNLSRERHRGYFTAISQRNVQQSRTNAHNYFIAKEYTNQSMDDGREALREAARKRQHDAREVAKEKARVERDLRLFTHVESFAANWKVGWPRGQLFPPAPRAPPTVWLKPPGPPEEEPETLTLLKKALAANLMRVVDLFRKWDVDHDHTINEDELRLALGSLKVPHTEQQLKQLFDNLDEDNSGFIDFEELYKALRKHGAKRAPTNHIELEMPKRHEPPPHGTAAERRAVAAIKKALHVNLQRVSDLFAHWDENGDGQISKTEIKRALGAQCIPVEDIGLNFLFKRLDADNSGGIDFRELNKLLRREFIFMEDVAEARVISVGDIRGPTPAGLTGNSPARPARRPSTVPAGLGKRGSISLGRHAPDGRAPTAVALSRRAAFEQQVARHDHADVAAVLYEKDARAAEQKEAQKKAAIAAALDERRKREQEVKRRRQQNLTVPPPPPKAIAAAEVRATTAPKLVKKR